MGHGNFNSNKIHSFLITWLIEYRKELAKIITKSEKSKTIVKERYFRFQTWMYQNVFNEVLLVWFKYQTKISSRSGVCVLEEWWKYTPASSSLSKDKGLRDTENRMSTGNLIWGINSVMVSYLIYYDSLLEIATDIITKFDSYFITKCDRRLLQNASSFLLQNATV